MGGTFDPIHIGHLIAASEVHSVLSLDAVWFIPAGEPWQKSDREVSSAQHRFAMTKLAVESDERFAVSDIEIRRQGPTRSIDTVRELRAQSPEIELYWIVGADVATRITSWFEWEQFVKEVTLVVVNRSESDVVVELPFTYVSIEMPAVRISATQLRERYKQGKSSKYLVPAQVDEYIKSFNIYGKQDG